MVISLLGQFIHYAVFGLLAPICLLPLALVLAQRTTLGAKALWALLTCAVFAAAILFAALVPRLGLPPLSPATTAPLIGALLIGTLFILAAPNTAQIASALNSAFERINHLIKTLVMWFVLIMALTQFGVVIFRYVFGVNSILVQESVTYMHASVFLLASGYALISNDHVRVDIFFEKLRPAKRAMVELFGVYVFLVPFCLVTLWAAMPYAANSWAIFEGSQEASGIPALFLLKSLIPAFAILLLMAGYVIAMRAATDLGASTKAEAK